MEQARSRKLMREVFANELGDHSVQGRAALAGRLLAEAKKTADNPVDRFVLLGGSIQAATESGSLELCFSAADAMAGAYEVDALAVKADAALALKYSGAGADDSERNVLDGLALVDELVAAEDLAVALRLSTLLESAASGNANLRLAAQRKSRELAARIVAHDRAARASEKLKVSPADPAANLAVGSYLCFWIDRWEAGVPLLARGDDPAIAAAACAELATPSAVDSQIAVGDAWWGASEKKAGYIAAAARRRASLWYDKALESVEVKGLNRTRLEKRVAEGDPGEVNEIIVEALIDGGSELHLTPGGLYWKQMGGAAKPGRHAANNLPTYVNHKPWAPQWGNPGKKGGPDQSALLPLKLGRGHYSIETLAVGGGDDDSTPDQIQGIEKRDPVTIEYRDGEQIIFIRDSQIGARWYRIRVYRQG
jgi:hypothetical protein